MHHKGKGYPGLHTAIVDRDLWDQVQARLSGNVQGKRSGPRTASPSLLAGRVVDEHDEPLLAAHAVKGASRYRYYVSRALHHKTSDTGLRVPAREIETLVAERVARLFDDPIGLVATAWLDVPADRYADLPQCCVEIAARQRQRQVEALAIVTRVRVEDSGVAVTCNTAAIAAALGVATYSDAPAVITLQETVRLTRSGHAVRLVHESGALATATVDQSLIRQILAARRWWRALREGEIDITRLAERDGVSPAYVTRIVRLAFLSPAAVTAVLAGKQRAGVDVKMLTLVD